MTLSSRSMLRNAVVIALTIALNACAGGLGNPPGGTSATAPLALGRAIARPLVVHPTKLNFTTVPVIRFNVSESNYAGSFTIRSADSRVVVVTPSKVRGPGPVNVKALAVSAGKTVVTITDARGNALNIPATVTTGVVIIQ